jgi:CBS domain-containing protein
MTASSETPLILSILALVVSLVVADGFHLAPMFLEGIREQQRKVKTVMSVGAVTVTEDMPARDIAHLMYSKNIKRVPVVREGRLGRSDAELSGQNRLRYSPEVIAALVMARANLHRQIQATTREAWLREFRENVSAFLAWHLELFEMGKTIVQSEEKVDQRDQAISRIVHEMRDLEVPAGTCWRGKLLAFITEAFLRRQADAFFLRR